jgi:hypothetical protein
MRILSSSALLLLPSIALLNLVSWSAAELTSLKIAILGPSERLIVLTKLDNWNKRPAVDRKESSIALISSSLGIAAANMADYKQYGLPDPSTPDAMQYSQFKTLDKMLEQKTGRKIRTTNFSNSAALISEDLLVAKEAVRLNAKPSLIVLAIAPRDFLDHFTATYHRSRLAQILISRQAPIWQRDKTPQVNLDVLMSKIWPYYSQRVEYRDLAIQAVCQAFNRSANLFSATQKLVSQNPKTLETPPSETQPEEAKAPVQLFLSDEVMSEEKLRKHELDYRGRYLPIDQDRWEKEINSLKQFTQFCHDQNIPLLIVAMPLTQRNRQLLPPEFLQKHMQAVQDLAKSKAVLLNLMDDERFVKTDFSDTAHLRSDGGVKFAEILSDEIKKQQGQLIP